jgi:hypothetical protein
MSEAAPCETYSAWLATLPAEDHYHAMIVRGQIISFWMVVICKSILRQKGLTVGQRLRVSEMLDAQGKGFAPLAADEIAMMQPAGKAENALFAASARATTGNRLESGAFDILTSRRMLDLLTAANPSVLDAIKYRYEKNKAAATDGRAALAARMSGATSTPPPPAERAPRYGHWNVPTQYDGPASNYEIPSRFLAQRTREQFAIGTPGHANGGINPHTGR